VRAQSTWPARSRAADERIEREARMLYEDAFEEITRGAPAAGQRILEVLIARFPNSPWAERGRQDIVGLYAERRQAGQAPVPPAATQRSALGAPPAAAAIRPAGGPAVASVGSPPAARTQHVQSAPPSAVAPSTPWHTEIERNARVAQDDLIMTVGDRVFFGPGSAELGAKARAILAGQARWLAANPKAIALVEGHADEPGSQQDNHILSERRASAVRQRLVDEGVEPGRLAVVVLGRDQRIALCADGGCAAQNRRAVTVVSYPRRAGVE
jgi:peptidoglycan-associated lipoprotein